MPPGMDLHGRGQVQRQGIPPPPPLINKPQRASPKPAKSPPASVGHAPMMGSITHGTAGSITQGTPVRTVTPGTPGSHQMSSVPYGTPLLSYYAANALYGVVISIYHVVKSIYCVVISICDMAVSIYDVVM